MLLHLLASASLALPATAPDDHGKLPWYEGTYTELLAKAKAEKKIIFLDFWTEW
jgi:hypothetical protein